MNNRDSMGLKGLVRELVTERQSGVGSSRTNWLFDRAGRIIKISSRNARGTELIKTFQYDDRGNRIEREKNFEVLKHADGSRTEIDVVSSFDNVVLGRVPKLPRTSFPTRGASTVETSYDPRGLVREAVFYNGEREVTARIVFKTDERGNVTGVSQFSGVKPTVSLPEAEKLRIPESDRRKFHGMFEPESLETRSVFLYDELDRLIEMAQFLSDNTLLSRDTYTYNEYGDKLTSVSETLGTAPVTHEFEYEYDSHGNWTRRVRVGSSDETSRRLTYYGESAA